MFETTTLKWSSGFSMFKILGFYFSLLLRTCLFTILINQVASIAPCATAQLLWVWDIKCLWQKEMEINHIGKSSKFIFDCGPFENPFWSSIRFSGTEPFGDVCHFLIWCQPTVFLQKRVWHLFWMNCWTHVYYTKSQSKWHHSQLHWLGWKSIYLRLVNLPP